MLRDEIRQALDEMPVVNGHEHWGPSIVAYADGQGYPMDPPFLLAHTYLFGDMIAAGAPFPFDEVPQRSERPAGDPAVAEANLGEDPALA